ncbi:hypothetical protein AB0G20_06030 [Streptomyces sp. NPDC024017]|uniref:hypothetical protein n=1 Tax=Streptomyces sp. NPDC024017 TaxID=3154326 RepID=UPI0033FF6B22
MRLLTKSAVRVASVATLTLGGLLYAPSAQAAPSAASDYCTGYSLIASYPVKTSGGTSYGTAYLYWKESSGFNCAVAVKNSAGGAGTKNYMSVTLTACKETKPKATCQESDDVYSKSNDGDNYAHYAGWVQVHTGKGHCVKLDAVIWKSGTFAQFSSGAFHCG